MTRWAVAKACCISQCSQYRETVISTYRGRWNRTRIRDLGWITTSATSPHIPNMGAIDLRGWSGRMREISLLVTFFVLFSFFFFVSTRVQVATVDLFLRSIYQNACFPARKCLLGFRWCKVMSRGQKTTKRKFLGVNARFKPNLQNIRLSISSKRSFVRIFPPAPKLLRLIRWTLSLILNFRD